MKASEFIKRLKELIEVVGDVDVVIHDKNGIYEQACIEASIMRPCIGSKLYYQDFNSNNVDVLSVY
jgi:hypothetical protein